MSLAGLKKQFNKANQYVSEKIGGAKGTELDDEFTEMERKIDIMGKLVDDLIIKTQEYLQPNPASRAKLSTMNAISKVRGQGKVAPYPQPEGILGEHMIKHGKDLGDDSTFGSCLQEAGETYKHLAEIKYNLEDNVKQNFLEPLALLQTKDLKEVNHHRKKLSGRRLDFDCKRRKKEKGSDSKGGSRDHGSNITDEELRFAEDKFEESKAIAETSMYNVLENEVEQIAQMETFVEAQLDYHNQAMESLQSLLEIIKDKRSEAASKPRGEHIPKRVSSFRRSESPSSSMFDTTKNDNYDGNSGSYNFSSNFNQTGYEGFDAFDEFEGPSRSQPCAEAMYDFIPENEGELGFSEGQVITLLTQIDENWYEGSVDGRTGFFPVNYVEVRTPLP
ncbi:endophilin-A3-like isoform X3 [Haliotis rufescens]|uniref:endophilin-A3-like isoform X3 n=1 Tax=Haliotis rufescens TaxID=6454 RepID=UPI001EB07CD3|nr:endophilin-A3-like isoform X3 [Haliotis rufescens]